MKKLGSIEGGLFRIKQSNHSNRIEELDSIDEFCEEVDEVIIFVATNKFHQEGRIDLG